MFWGCVYTVQSQINIYTPPNTLTPRVASVRLYIHVYIQLRIKNRDRGYLGPKPRVNHLTTRQCATRSRRIGSPTWRLAPGQPGGGYHWPCVTRTYRSSRGRSLMAYAQEPWQPTRGITRQPQLRRDHAALHDSLHQNPC